MDSENNFIIQIPYDVENPKLPKFNTTVTDLYLLGIRVNTSPNRFIITLQTKLLKDSNFIAIATVMLLDDGKTVRGKYAERSIPLPLDISVFCQQADIQISPALKNSMTKEKARASFLEILNVYDKEWYKFQTFLYFHLSHVHTCKPSDLANI